MPRKKPELGPRGASSVWYSRSLTFDLGIIGHADKDYARDQRRMAKCKQELAKYIGLTPADEAFLQVLREVERLLAQYVFGAVQAVDNAPRPSDYMSSYRKLQIQVNALSKLLGELSPRVRELLEARLMDSAYGDLESTEMTLDAFGRTLTELQRDIRAQGQSAGRPKNTALRMTVHGLQKVFREHYNGPRESKPKRGAFKFSDEMTKRERDFVTAALEAAKIPAAGLEKLWAPRN